jgi:serine/threonine protein phosphatase PrpC
MPCTGQLPYAIRNRQNEREQNEDSYHIMTISPHIGSDLIYVLAVADGMGGHVYGELVSKEALRKISLSLVDSLCVEPGINQPMGEDAIQIETLKEHLYESLQQANAHVRRMVETNHWGKAGTTVVVALILNDTVVVGNLGDSPLFHFQARAGKLVKRTEDHTVAGVLLRGGMITE